jgi:hypothetical protein
MEINYICSLGTLCHPAVVMKNKKLKLASYPFDWVFSSPKIIIDCLEDDFKKFLDKTNYVNIKNKWNNNQCGHKIFHENFFNHRDPRKEIDYNYYIRCVDRFNKLLKYPENKLFVIMYINKNSYLDAKEEIINFNKKFSNYTNNYTLLCIIQIVSRTSKVEKEIIDNIHFYYLYTTSRSTGTLFYSKDDTNNLNNIFDNYKYNLLEMK